MKNFRKVLALVLVVATLFSFAAMASAKYEDEDKISYNEAVSVLSQMGILNGYEVAEDEFEFKPTNEISREEMAKMIAVLANAGSDVSKLYASANTFADVENDRWSASYIAYCAQTGIVAGRTATTFDPYGNITGLETAKMLLVVLGFDAQEQGYVGANWKINVMRDAKVMGLTNGFAADYDIEAKITREEAANMMLNALEAPCVVGTLSGSIINITNALVFKGDTEKANVVNYLKVNSFATLKDALAAGKWSLYENVVISDDLLCDVLYGMEKIDDADCYGRPGSIWTYKNAAGTVKKIAATTSAPFFYSYDTTNAKLKTELKDYLKNDAQIWVNGAQLDPAATTQNVEQCIDLLTGDYAIGHGTEVEAYRQYNTDGSVWVKIIVKTTQITKIASVNVAKGTFTVVGTSKTFVNEFGLTPANVGDVALAWWCAENKDNCLHDLKLVEPTVVTVKTARAIGTAPRTAHDIAQSTFTTTEGKKFEYAEQFNMWMAIEGTDIIGAAGDAAANIGDTLDLYLDEFGFVMGYAKTDDIDWTVAVVEEGSLYQAPVYYVDRQPVYDHNVDLLAFDANVTETEDVAISDDAAAKPHTGHGTLVKYYVNEDGEAEFVTSDVDAFNVQLKAGKAALVNGVASDNETQYIVRFKDYSTGDYVYKYFVGKGALDADYKADLVQIFTDASGKFADYVYVECSVAAVAEKAFVLGYAYDEITLTDGGKIAYTGYEVLVGGEPAILATTQDLSGVNKGFDKLYDVTAKYVGMSTADGLPVYQALTTATEAGLTLDLAYSAGSLVDASTPSKVLDIAADAKLIVAFDTDWDDDDDATTDALEYVVCTMEDLASYMTAAGWTSVRNYVVENADEEVIELYIVLNVAP